MGKFLDEIRNRVLVFDGSKGYMLQKLGMKGGECPELWNVKHPLMVREVYELYKNAGSDVIQTNTFQGSRKQLEKYSLGERTYELNFEGTRLAREVMGGEGFVAASIGPLGELLEPLGGLTFEDAYEAFKEQLKAVIDGGADIINFETFTDLAEMRVALLAAKELSDLPVICSIAFESNGRTLMGTEPYTAAVVLKSLGAHMIGTNCSFGPEHLLEIIKGMSRAGDIYLCAKPNAGLPEMLNGEAVYKESPERFALLAAEFVKYGVRLIGGCCGTTPEFVASISENIKGLSVPETAGKLLNVITSSIRVLNLDTDEKINLGTMDAWSDNMLSSELSKNNMEYIADMSMDMSGENYDAVYINIDKAAGDPHMLGRVVNTAQGYLKVPFIIETGDPSALNNTLRVYRGIAGVVVDGYPDKIAEQLLETAKRYGSNVIDRERITVRGG